MTELLRDIILVVTYRLIAQLPRGCNRISRESSRSDRWINTCACLARKLLFSSARYSTKTKT